MTEAIAAQREATLDRLFEGYEGPVFGIRLWDGWRWVSHGRGNPKYTLVFRSQGALHSLIAQPSEISLGEAFIAKDIDIEGDLFSAFAMAEHVFHSPKTQVRRLLGELAGTLSQVGQWWSKGKAHTPERDGSAISYHYNQPVEFYRPWLGKTMVYSCGYFPSKNETLDAAQTNKMELICRKLRLKPLERFLDIGCGWGALVIHAASRHNVFAQGITLSHNQADIGVQRIEMGHLTQSSQIELLDYRAAPKHFTSFDKIASVGMFEHVGLRNLPQYFRTAYDLLKPGGVFLNHGIARVQFGSKKLPNTSFIDKYVFPDGELVTLTQAIHAAELAGFEVRDVENLREHYELTLHHWVEALQANAHEVLQHVAERVYRIWLLYMAGSAAAFQRGDLGLYQMLLCRPDHGRSGLPLTRDDWYRVF